jgi:hypothetical protein
MPPAHSVAWHGGLPLTHIEPSDFVVAKTLRLLVSQVLRERPEASDELILKAVITRIRNYPDATMRRALCNWVGIG